MYDQLIKYCNDWFAINFRSPEYVFVSPKSYEKLIIELKKFHTSPNNHGFQIFTIGGMSNVVVSIYCQDGHFYGYNEYNDNFLKKMKHDEEFNNKFFKVLEE